MTALILKGVSEGIATERGIKTGIGILIKPLNKMMEQVPKKVVI